MGVINKMFRVHLTCMNCRWKEEKQLLIRTEMSVELMFSDRSLCFQCLRKRRMMERTLLSSTEGVSSMT
ncbi:MAG: hypothetical protein K2K09_04330, partial [Lachnospiraceae bacterium]|nr:hypothetical protein [Lachnospiraceae bacterium]